MDQYGKCLPRMHMNSSVRMPCGQQDGSAVKGACHQACQPEFNLQNTQGRRELIPKSCPLISIWALWHVHTTHRHTNNK